LTDENGTHAEGVKRIGPHEQATITLILPCAAEYVGTARLTILGVASRMGFSYDQIEDIRLAVGEACTNAIERTRLGGGSATENLLTIRSHVDARRLQIEIEDNAPASLEAEETAEDSEEESINSAELGALLMEILVDEVAVETLPGGGSRVRLIKYASEA